MLPITSIDKLVSERREDELNLVGSSKGSAALGLPETFQFLHGAIKSQ